MSEQVLTFTMWLSKFRDESTPLGDLARDAKQDSNWPRSAKNKATYVHYINSFPSSERALETLERAWGMYEEEITQ